MNRLMEFLEKYLGGFFGWWKRKTRLPTIQYGKNFSVSWSGVVFWLLLILAMVVFLPACSSVKPYAEIGLGYQIDRNTDYWLETDRSWQCSKQPQFHGELGIELKHDWKIGYHHQSWLMCGKPFGGGQPEVYADDIRITKKWGGM